MNLTDPQKRLILRVVNKFETGTADGDYADITLLKDGPGGIRQVTYGRSQTTEYGNLRDLVQAYIDAGGKLANDLKPYLPKIGKVALDKDDEFLGLLKDAGRNDPIMRTTQDKFFDTHYYDPAMRWATQDGFKEPLSALVIYDSFIHSGTILKFLRQRFPESVPAKGGNERKWIEQYVDVRHHWLANHSNNILQNTIYRTKCFQREIDRGNWDLSQTPINANGTDIS